MVWVANPHTGPNQPLAQLDNSARRPVWDEKPPLEARVSRSLQHVVSVQKPAPGVRNRGRADCTSGEHVYMLLGFRQHLAGWGTTRHTL